jgi:hypothetical protein
VVGGLVWGRRRGGKGDGAYVRTLRSDMVAVEG